MSSTRLPRKALAEVAGRPVLWHVVQRMQFAHGVDRVVIATSDGPDCDPIRELARESGFACFSGSELDLIDRLYRTALTYDGEALIRITADCPLVDPSVVDQLVATYRAAPAAADLVTNVVPRTFPHGLDVELFPTRVLKRLHAEIEDPHWREWFPTYVTNRPEQFRIVNVANESNLSGLRWTLDHPEDLAFVRAVYQGVYQPDKPFRMSDVLDLLDSDPGIQRLNEMHTVHHA